ncbi:transposase [Mesorhizobium sp. M1050]|uniref:hypothetical protein n=1 Tax=Mesorhizobium sp. M1050 TaxID=2957051 RepID=UPI00333CF1CF
MPNHVHLILTPADPDGLRRALAKVHRAYAGTIHARRKKTRHFWQGRFGAVAMDEDHLLSAVRYVGLNPVRAGLVSQAADWPWSSARAHLTDEANGVTDLGPMKDRLPSSAGLFDLIETDVAAFDALRKAEHRPAGGQRRISGPGCRANRKGREIGKARQAAKRKWCTVTVILMRFAKTRFKRLVRRIRTPRPRIKSRRLNLLKQPQRAHRKGAPPLALPPAEGVRCIQISQGCYRIS